MTNLTRWEPYREVANVRRMRNRFFDESWQEMPVMWQRGDALTLALDVAEQDDHYIVRASVPGINPADLEITVANKLLTIQGEMKADQAMSQAKYHLRERRLGRFTRTIALPQHVDADRIEAINEHGVLTLVIPKAEAVKPRRIDVRQPGETN